MACCDTPTVILQTIQNNQALLVAVTHLLASDPTVMSAIAANLVSTDANNSISLGSDGLLYENDSVV